MLRRHRSGYARGWSGTTADGDPTLAWIINFRFGSVAPGGSKAAGVATVWCVRGGTSLDAQ